MYYRSILLVSLLCYCSLVFGQRLSEQAGAIPTQFIFTMGGDTLPITDQYLLKRGEAGSETGYESYYLEFMSTAPLVTVGRIWNKQSCSFVLYDEEGTRLASINKSLRTVFPRQSERVKFYFFNFSLSFVPFTLLDHTHRIEIAFR